MQLLTTAREVAVTAIAIMKMVHFWSVDPSLNLTATALSIDIPVIELAMTEEQQIDTIVDTVCASYPSVDPAIVKSVIWHESRYDPNAKNCDGTCVGLMQVSTRWHADRAAKLGVTDFFDPYENILLGVDYLQELIDRYQDPYLVLMVYNMGDSKALKLHRQGKTTRYSRSVMERAYVSQAGGV